jgi:hypothetical protein
MDMSRIRIEGLLAAFPKLVGSGNKQHTYVETENVRYVYQPIEVGQGNCVRFDMDAEESLYALDALARGAVTLQLYTRTGSAEHSSCLLKWGIR